MLNDMILILHLLFTSVCEPKNILFLILFDFESKKGAGGDHTDCRLLQYFFTQFTFLRLLCVAA